MTANSPLASFDATADLSTSYPAVVDVPGPGPAAGVNNLLRNYT
jgi:hypothetical protein